MNIITPKTHPEIFAQSVLAAVLLAAAYFGGLKVGTESGLIKGRSEGIKDGIYMGYITYQKMMSGDTNVPNIGRSIVIDSSLPQDVKIADNTIYTPNAESHSFSPGTVISVSIVSGADLGSVFHGEASRLEITKPLPKSEHPK